MPEPYLLKEPERKNSWLLAVLLLCLTGLAFVFLSRAFEAREIRMQEFKSLVIRSCVQGNGILIVTDQNVACLPQPSVNLEMQ